jgi:hypothetical protein
MIREKAKNLILEREWYGLEFFLIICTSVICYVICLNTVVETVNKKESGLKRGIWILSNFFSHVLSPFIDLMVSNSLKAKGYLSEERKK